MPKGKKGTGRPKHLSRAARCAKACAELRVQADDAEDIADAIDAMENPTIEAIKAIKVRVDGLSVDTDELESLKGEIEEWRDNMPEGLQNGDKYATLDETANTLDNVVGELQGIDVPVLEIPEKLDDDGKDKLLGEFTGLPDALHEFAQTINEQCDEAEAVEFPGMMG